MAQPATITGAQIFIKIETAPDSGVFSHPCLINAERGIVFSSDNSSEVIPDCDNPDDPGWKVVTVDGFQATINGAGKLDKNSVVMFSTWFTSGDAKNIRIQLNDFGYWPGAFKLTEWTPATGDRGVKATSSVTMVSDGTVGPFVVL